MPRIINIVLSSFVIFLMGCGTRYMVGEETFYSSAEALQKIEVTNASLLKDITTTNNPINSTVLVVVPSDFEIQNNYVRYRGNSSMFDKASMEYMITVTRKYFQVTIDAIKKRGIFESVSVANHNGNPASFPIENHNFMVFRDIDGWFITGANNPRPLPIKFNASKPVSSDHIITFLESLSQQANTIRSK